MRPSQEFLQVEKTLKNYSAFYNWFKFYALISGSEAHRLLNWPTWRLMSVFWVSIASWLAAISY